ncbi:hypothetical protein V2G26_001112 [Clonostachys chloroleuca]
MNHPERSVTCTSKPKASPFVRVSKLPLPKQQFPSTINVTQSWKPCGISCGQRLDHLNNIIIRVVSVQIAIVPIDIVHEPFDRTINKHSGRQRQDLITIWEVALQRQGISLKAGQRHQGYIDMS